MTQDETLLQELLEISTMMTMMRSVDPRLDIAIQQVRHAITKAEGVAMEVCGVIGKDGYPDQDRLTEISWGGRVGFTTIQ